MRAPLRRDRRGGIERQRCTIPALVGVGLAGHVTGNRWQAATARATPVLSLLNAGLLGSMAWRMVA